MNYFAYPTKKIPVLLILLSLTFSLFSQESGLEFIDVNDLKGHMYFLASDELSGRATMEPSIHVAAKYIAGELKKLGIRAIDEDKDYFQNYTLINTEYDWDNTFISIEAKNEKKTMSDAPFYLFPFSQEDLEVSGEVVFTGYGVSSTDEEFDEFANVDVTGKIVIVMDGAPQDEEGNSRFEGVALSGYFRFFTKLMTAQNAGAKAVIFVYPPNSDYQNLLDEYPMFKSFISGSTRMDGDANSGQMSMIPGVVTKLILTEREVVDQLLKGTEMTLAELQDQIDSELKPKSFLIPDKTITIRTKVKELRLQVPNVVGFIEGSDPDLKDEVVLYSAHFDHIGAKDNENIFNGADDNSSGSIALLELAEAFQSLSQKPKRSIILLWVSGEEIGLYGSKFYSNNPLIPLTNTLVDINLDMVGRVKTEADSVNPEMITERETVFVIGGHQSKELLELNDKVFKKMKLTPDYSLGDLNHPERLYYRSDHINFAQKDVPSLFITTGLHADYHTLRDTYDRIDFDKFLAVTKLVYMLGFEVANRQERIVVDNPYSTW